MPLRGASAADGPAPKRQRGAPSPAQAAVEAWVGGVQAGEFFSPSHVAKALLEAQGQQHGSSKEQRDFCGHVDKALKALAAAGRLHEVPPLPGGGNNGPKRVFTLASTSEDAVRRHVLGEAAQSPGSIMHWWLQQQPFQPSSFLSAAEAAPRARAAFQGHLNAQGCADIQARALSSDNAAFKLKRAAVEARPAHAPAAGKPQLLRRLEVPVKGGGPAVVNDKYIYCSWDTPEHECSRALLERGLVGSPQLVMERYLASSPLGADQVLTVEELSRAAIDFNNADLAALGSTVRLGADALPYTPAWQVLEAAVVEEAPEEGHEPGALQPLRRHRTAGGRGRGDALAYGSWLSTQPGQLIVWIVEAFTKSKGGSVKALLRSGELEDDRVYLLDDIAARTPPFINAQLAAAGSQLRCPPISGKDVHNVLLGINAPPQPLMRCLSDVGTARLGFVTLGTSDAFLEQHFNQLDEVEAALRAARGPPSAGQTLERHVFVEGGLRVAVDVYGDVASVLVTSHEHSDHAGMLEARLIKALRDRGCTKTLCLPELVHQCFAVITKHNTPPTADDLEGGGVDVSRLHGVRVLRPLRPHSLPGDLLISAVDTAHANAGHGFVVTFPTGATFITTADALLDESAVGENFAAAVRAHQDWCTRHGVALDIKLQHAPTLVVMTGHKSSSRTAAAAELAPLLFGDGATVYVQDAIHEHLVGFGADMAAFTADASASAFHVLTLGGSGVPLKRSAQHAFLQEYAARLGHHRVLYIESTGWYRPSDGTTYLMGGIDAATYQAQGGVRLVAISLSDHSTLGAVRAFLARMHSEFVVLRRQIRPLTSGLDDVSHLCTWDE